MANQDSTRAFTRSLVHGVFFEVRNLAEGGNGTRPRLADLLMRAELDLLALVEG